MKSGKIDPGRKLTAETPFDAAQDKLRALRKKLREDGFHHDGLEVHEEYNQKIFKTSWSS
ncbi:MAG TPA: hypothetical protein VEG60_12150 [Candidatus Binatia bacterium]|nr:hypothetical protein [Candidatus Binatia bacterium]